MLGDAYCAAIVEALSKDDLARMDKEKELLEAEEGIGEGQSLIDNMEKGTKESGKVQRNKLLLITALYKYSMKSPICRTTMRATPR